MNRKLLAIFVLAPLLMAAVGYGGSVLIGPSGTVLTNVTCTAGCTQSGSTLDVNATGGSGYSTVQDEGGALTARTVLNFAGAGVACVDDTTRTTCTIAGGAGSPAGATTQVQFNNGGSFGADVDLTYNSTTNTLTTTNFAGTASLAAALSTTGTTTQFWRGDNTWAAPTATASAGGSDTQVQYNNATALAGATNVKIVSNNLTLVAPTTPAASASGEAVLFAKNRAGRMHLNVKGPIGADVSLQPTMYGQSIQMMRPNTGTTVPVVFGNTWTGRASTGTLSHPAIATTNHLTLMRSSLYTSGAAAGQGYGIQGTFAMNYFGNAANRGGFFFFCRFGFTAYSSAARVFIGLSTQNAAYGATEPSTVNNTVGICKDSGDATAFFCTRNGTTTTKSAATFTPTTATIYDFSMYVAPNSTTVTYRLVDETNGTTIYDNVATSATTPAVNTLLYPWTWVGASSAVSQIMAVGIVYVESDF